MENDNRRTFAEQSIDTRLLVSLLIKTEIGDLVTYGRMKLQVSRTMSGADSHLQSALKIVERDHHLVFGVVRGVGYKRLADGEIVATGAELPRRIRRMARKTVRTLSKARDERLTNAERIQRNAATSMAGVIAHVASDKVMRRLESAVQANDAAGLSIGRTLEVFGT